MVGASVAFSGVRFKAGLQSNRDGPIAVLTRMDGDLLRSWSPALSRPRCSNRRDHHGVRGSCSLGMTPGNQLQEPRHTLQATPRSRAFESAMSTQWVQFPIVRHLRQWYFLLRVLNATISSAASVLPISGVPEAAVAGT